MNKIQEIIDKVRKCKEDYVKLQNFEIAYNWREVERNLIKVTNGESLRDFFEQFKCLEYINSEEMYEIIKTLDVEFLRKQMISLRKEKISKIEKLYNDTGIKNR